MVVVRWRSGISDCGICNAARGCERAFTGNSVVMASFDLVGDGLTRDAVRYARLDFFFITYFAAAISSMLPGRRCGGGTGGRGSRYSTVARGADGPFLQLDSGRNV